MTIKKGLLVIKAGAFVLGQEHVLQGFKRANASSEILNDELILI